ncbi:MAG: hypothetical protein RQ966_01955 [Acetobacteraceae bacterium]|nr:hypothetical protein [Acetobacteraceae bacterium]
MRRSLWPLFLVSGAAVGLEIALTRYFAVAKWSEYGYWVISIVMAGFALSGVAVALARDAMVRRGDWLLAWLPAVMIVAAALGYWATTLNPFNPLQLQNAATYGPQLVNIGLYYVALLPFFFLAGLYVSLSFVVNGDRVATVYGYDLTGAGAGAALVLGLMFLLHPFSLVPALLVPLALAAPASTRGKLPIAAACLALMAGEALLLGDARADYNDFKAIYAPLHTPDARQVAEIRSPRGLYALLDDFTERVDTDVSNNAGMLGVPGPPQSFGLYRDGSRIAALPKPGLGGAAYAPAELDALPYRLAPHGTVLLAGTSGGFAIAHALALGAVDVTALEPDPVLLSAITSGLGPAKARATDPRVHLSASSPLAITGRYDLIDLAGDFLEAGEANAASFSEEAIEGYLRALKPGGSISIPVSIREFPVYAVRVLATVRDALLASGVADPAQQVVVYRSAWNVRILVSRSPWTAEQIALVRRFCDERSFDVSYYPGIDVAAARANIYNDLPPIDFESGEVESSAAAQDAVADEAELVLRGRASPSQQAFDLRPITLDRPFFYAILRLGRLPQILSRLEILPQQEVGQLVNVAVLAQSAVLALLVLAVPLFAPRVAQGAGGRAPVLRAIVYFACLGLGFLCIEIFLIEKASFYLNDRTSAFALVLTGMLVFSGFGSLLASRIQGGITTASAIIVGWCLLALLGLEPLLLHTIGLPWALRALILLMLTAPVSVALGSPFPLGLARAGSGAMLPWAWALNGAFSVVATPLANLLAVHDGFDRVLMAAVLLYVFAFLSFPSVRKSLRWPSPAPHPRAEPSSPPP